MPQLEFQTGLYDGHAVGYCPQTDTTVAVPLRDVARNLHQRGYVNASPSMLDHLDTLTTGDDDAIEAAGDDDLIEVGAGKVRKKIAKGIKKTVKAAKKVVKSKLGKVLAITASLASGGAAGAGLMALHKGAKLVKKAKTSPKHAKAVKVASALSKGKISKGKAVKHAVAVNVPPTQILSTAQALQTVDAARAGDPAAQAALATHQDIQNATEAPLDMQPAGGSGGGGGGDSSSSSDDGEGASPQSANDEAAAVEPSEDGDGAMPETQDVDPDTIDDGEDDQGDDDDGGDDDGEE